MEKSKTGHGKMKTKKTIKIGIGLIMYLNDRGLLSQLTNSMLEKKLNKC